ncbi:MAG: ATP-dependent DNA helicase RecG [Bacteroidales bacterium]|nr:ATP-dependent DNA helicase RecG [Bacteroidales bacterium]
MPDIFDTPITYLKGVGPKKAELFAKELGINTYDDLLNYYPFRYVDKSQVVNISDIKSDAVYVQIKGVVRSLASTGDKRLKYITVKVADATGSIDLVFFRGLKWVLNTFVTGKSFFIFGKPSVFRNSYNFVHPEVEEDSGEPQTVSGPRLEGIYSTTEKLKNAGLGSRGIGFLIRELLNQTSTMIRENLPDYLLKQYQLADRKSALVNIHFPQQAKNIEPAVKRLKFEELLFIQLELLTQKNYLRQKISGHRFEQVGELFMTYYEKKLPFELTNAQKRVIREMRIDMKTGRQMNRLLQGDVGSGKTLVALMMSLLAIDNGFQACIMAPTEILATQHFNTITKMLDDMEVEVALLTGSTKKKQRTFIHERLVSGQLNLLIGTHAVIEDAVQFSQLGFVVIDEQHRFGVLQRARLWKKSTVAPHVLVMTATPIPRTLAMTLYGNLDVSVIDELPPGRKPIKTVHYFDSKRLLVNGFMKKQIELGRQIYVVYPLINESENLDLKNLMDGFEQIQRDFPLPNYQVSVVHGRMKAEEKEFEMQRFVEGKTDIMVSTTVIEVGVDVPNASVMIIENAERFGLSQLHQLRGRVGRGADQSYCILMSGNKLTNEGRKRLEIMVRSNDGFEIAEADLKLRGPGDMQGTKQSGVLDLRIANLAQDGELIAHTRKVAERILEKDEKLTQPENELLRNQLIKNKQKSGNWSRIS